MKKNISLLILLFFVHFFYGQRFYDFDYAVNLVMQKTSIKTSTDYLINSKNNHYKIHFQNIEKKTWAELTDFENGFSHFFNVNTATFPLKEKDFVYQYTIITKKIEKQAIDESKRRFFSVIPVKKDSTRHIFKVIEYKNEKMTKKRGEAEVVLLPFQHNITSDAIGFLFDYFDYNNGIKFPGNYILESGVFKGKEIKNEEISVKTEYIIPNKITLKINEIIYFKSS